MSSESALHFGSFAAHERQGEVDPFDFAEPVLGVGAVSSLEKAGFDVVEAWQHFGVDVEHGAADAGVFVAAWGGVGAATAAEFDFAFVEVCFEFCPVVVGDGRIFLWWAQCAAALEVGLVVAGDVFVEDCDVTACGFEVEVAEQGGADVDG